MPRTTNLYTVTLQIWAVGEASSLSRRVTNVRPPGGLYSFEVTSVTFKGKTQKVTGQA